MNGDTSPISAETYVLTPSIQVNNAQYENVKTEFRWQNVENCFGDACGVLTFDIYDGSNWNNLLTVYNTSDSGNDDAGNSIILNECSSSTQNGSITDPYSIHISCYADKPFRLRFGYSTYLVFDEGGMDIDDLRIIGDCKEYAPCHPDYDGLVAMYKSTYGQNWTNKSGWLNENCDVCSWFGVTCNSNNRVTEIDLADNNLTGYLSELFYQLPFLEKIDLSQNLIRVTIPNYLFSSQVITHIDLHDNYLVGSLPQSLTEASNALLIDLSDNIINGTTPLDIDKLNKLETLNLSINYIYSYLPPTLGNLSLIKNIDLSDNLISRCIPHKMKSLCRSTMSMAPINVDLSDNWLDNTLFEKPNSMLAIPDFGNNNFGECESCKEDYTLFIDDVHDDFWDANNSVTSDVILYPGSNVIFRAGNFIELQPIFEVAIDSKFQAIIKECQN